MADFVNTTTLELRPSESSMPDPWVTITRSALLIAQVIPQHYRKWTGSAVAEMTQGEKDTVDAALLVARNTGLKGEVTAPTALAAFALLVLDQINTLRGLHSLSELTKAQMKTAWENKVDTLNGGGF